MLLRRLLPFIFLFSGLFVCGNNLNLGSSVKIIDVTSSEVTFEISVSWSNSWSDGFNNDAAWIFFKYRTVSGDWSHLFLNGAVEVSEGYSFFPGSSGGALTGLFLFRSASGSGTSSSVCRLTWNYSGTGLTSADFHQNKVFFMGQGIEMVYVPFGSFVLGDGASSSSFVDSSGSPVRVTGDGSEIPVPLHTLGSSSSVSLSGTYPSGFNGFYIMKYELSQEQYVAFINSLSRSDQLTLLPQLSTLTKGQYVFGSPHSPDNRNGIIVSVPLSDGRSAVLDNNLTNDNKYGNSDDGRTVACNYMCISDLLSYTAWSGLRPLAETEYEKTCRRLLPQTPTAREYAWGTTSLTSMSAVVSETAGWNNETPNNGNANAEGAFGTFPGSGPVRCGAFSAVATSRIEAGSTFSGVMEMSGNLSELCVNASRYSVNNFDGSVHGSGSFTLSEWGRGVASSFGLRGGGFSSDISELRVSDRSLADNNHFSSLTLRDSTVGFRGVRMLDPAAIAFNAGSISLGKEGDGSDVVCSGEPFTLIGSPAFASGITGLSMHYSWYMDGELLPDEQGESLSFPIGIFNKNNTDKTFSFRREVSCALGTFSSSFSLTVPGRLQLSLPGGVNELQLSCNISSVVTASRNRASSFRWVNGTSGVALTGWSAPATESRYTPSHIHFGYVGAQRKLRCVSDMGGCKDSVDVNLFILPSCSLSLDKTAISMSSNTNGETVTASLCGAGEVGWYYLDDSGRENVISSAMTSVTPNGASSASSYTTAYTPKYADFKNTIGLRKVIVRSSLGDNTACQDRQELSVSVSATLSPGTITAPSPSVACGNTDVIIGSSQSAGVEGMPDLSPVYQWFVDGGSTPLANETSSTLKYRLPANATNSPVTHTFVRKAFTSSPALLSDNSNTVTVTVPGVPSATITVPSTVCDGQSLALPSPVINWAGLSGNGNWTLNGVVVPEPVRYTNNGQTLIYTLSNSCHASVKSSGVNIIVNNKPTVKTLSAPVAVCSGNALPYPAVPVVEWNGSNGSVAWKLNGSVVPNPVQIGHNGQTLTYVATNGCGTSPSNGVPITVNDKPLVGSLSSPSAVCAGTSLILPSAPSVTWRSETGSVAWKLNNNAVPNPVQIGHNDQLLTYEATSSCGTTASNGVPITVKPVTVITTHPVSQPICSGQTATLSVVAGGTGPFSYQWKNGSTAISGATSASYTASSAGGYSCVVTGGCGSATSNTATLTVNTNPTISTTPNSVCGSGTVTLSAVPSSGASIEWFAAASGGTPLLTGNTYTTPTISATTTYYAGAKVASTGCVSTSRTAVVATVNTNPTISTTPNSVCGSGTVTLSAVPSSGASIEWFAAASGGTPLLTGNTYTTPTISATTTYYAGAKVASTGCVSTSRTAVVATVNVQPTVTGTTPISRCGAGTVALSAVPSSGATIEWYSAASGGNPLFTGNTYTTPTISATTTYYAGAKISSTGCVSTSRTAVVATVNVQPTVTGTTPNSVCGSGTVALSAVPSSGAAIEWYSASSGGTVLSSGNTYTTPSISATTTYYAGAKVASTGCVSTSRTAVVATVNTNPTISTTPNSVCGSGTVTLSAVPSSGASIEWFAAASGGTPLLTGNTYTTPTISSTTTYYAGAKVASTGCVSTSRTAVVATVNVQPTVTGTTPNSRCGSGTVVLSAVPSSGATIEWYSASSGGNLLSSSNTYTTPTISATTTYYAGAKVASTGCISTSRTAVVATVNVQPTVTGTTPNSRCGAGTVVLSAVPSSGAAIEWYSAASGGTVLSSGNTYTTPSISATTTYYAGAKVASTGCVSTSRTAVVATVNVQPTVTGTTPNSRCGAGTVALSAVPSSGASIEWFAAASGGTPLLTGNTYTTPTISATTTYYAGAKISSTGCVSTSRTAVVATVNVQPTVTGTTPNSVCGSGTVTLSAVPSSGATIEWYSAASGGTPLLIGNTYTTPSISATTTYYAGAKVASTGCVSTSRTAVAATVTNSIISSAGSLIASSPSCEKVTLSNSASASVNCGDISYEWYEGTTKVGTGAGPITLTNVSAGTHKYKRRAIASSNTSSSSYTAEVSVTVTPCAAPGGEKTALLCDNKVWMVQNLNDSRSGQCYENNASYCVTDGRLYTWDEALTICPSGWHLPSDGEFNTLNTCFNKTAWQPQYAGYYASSRWYSRGLDGYWWASAEYDPSPWHLGTSDTKLSPGNYGEDSRNSVRCVKDIPTISAGGNNWTTTDVCTSCTWNQAVTACNNVGMRLPNNSDWSALGSMALPAVPRDGYYWSATENGSTNAYLWNWYGSGYGNSFFNKSNAGRVRCIKN